jgi:hypothetical protein
MTLHEDAMRTLRGCPSDGTRERFLELLERGPDTLWREHNGTRLVYARRAA